MSLPKAQAVKKFREATGMGWMEAKLFLAGRSAELCERILEARVQQPDANTLHDPLEDDPRYSELFVSIRDSVEAELRAEIASQNETRIAIGNKNNLRNWPLGTCHRMWRIMKDRLAAEGVVWYSLADLNPGHHFD